MKILTIHGERWGPDVNGHAYYTVAIYVNGRLTHKTPVQEGHGSSYGRSAGEWLRDNGYLPNTREKALCVYCYYNDIPFVDVVSDVARRQDL